MAGISISVTADTKLVERVLGKLSSQVPFATALALTKTAQATAQLVQRSLGKDFTIRNTWTARGVRSRPADKFKLEAAVGSLDPYMASQAIGGLRRKGQGRGRGQPVGRVLAVPTKKLRKSKGALIKRGKMPKALLAKGSRFFIDKAAHSKTVALFQRVGRGRNATRVALWIFKRAVMLRKRWPLHAHVAKGVALYWPEAARTAIERALATARR